MPRTANRFSLAGALAFATVLGIAGIASLTTKATPDSQDHGTPAVAISLSPVPDDGQLRFDGVWKSIWTGGRFLGTANDGHLLNDVTPNEFGAKEEIYRWASDPYQPRPHTTYKFSVTVDNPSEPDCVIRIGNRVVATTRLRDNDRVNGHTTAYCTYVNP